MGFLPRFTRSPFARGGLSMRNPILRFAVTVTCLVLCSAPYQDQAEGYTFTSIDFPGASGSSAFGINDGGQIVGNYAIHSDGGGGFLYSGGSFTPLNIPPGTPAGINAGGQIVGIYFDAATGRGHGFLDSGGRFTSIDVPGALVTYPTGINTGGQIVGIFHTPWVSTRASRNVPAPRAGRGSMTVAKSWETISMPQGGAMGFWTAGAASRQSMFPAPSSPSPPGSMPVAKSWEPMSMPQGGTMGFWTAGAASRRSRFPAPSNLRLRDQCRWPNCGKLFRCHIYQPWVSGDGPRTLLSALDRLRPGRTGGMAVETRGVT